MRRTRNFLTQFQTRLAWTGALGVLALTVAAASIPAANAGPTCKCRFNGKFFAVGERTCIRGRVATCSLVLNNSSWTISNQACSPVAMSPRPSPLRLEATTPGRTPLPAPIPGTR